MKLLTKFLIIFFLLHTNVKASTFSEVFGSEGAAGINNPKIRDLSFTLQYFTLVGSVGYIAKQLFESGYLSPIGLVPDSINNLSPLAYKNNFNFSPYDAKVFSVNAKVDQMNIINDYKRSLANNKFSFKSIERRNNSNFFKSETYKNQRDNLIDRYLSE
tara:strand:- start:212 stop:688 length:477 start_codon:yes stop_codon:yes gene_type:complete